MKRLHQILAVLSLATALLAACGDDSDDGDDAAPSESSDDTEEADDDMDEAGAPGSVNATIDGEDFTFEIGDDQFACDVSTAGDQAYLDVADAANDTQEFSATWANDDAAEIRFEITDTETGALVWGSGDLYEGTESGVDIEGDIAEIAATFISETGGTPVDGQVTINC
jgi:hypothetical protein